MRAEMVYSGHPVGLHGGFLFFRVLAPVAFDLDDEVEKIIFAVPVIDAHDEVGQVEAVF